VLAENAVSVVRLQGLTASIQACEALVYTIATQIDLGHEPAAEVYVACKAAATEALGDAADLLVQMLGGRGYIEANGAPQILRDARVLRILEGPTETLYAHLGAALAKPGGAGRAFLADALGRSALCTELDAAMARVATLAEGAQRLFGSKIAARQWTDYKLGELSASAFLLGAAERRQQSQSGDAQAASNAVVWARRRFNHQLQALLAELAGQRPYSSSGDLLALVAGYAQEIGDVDQQLPGEDQQPDALLLRAGVKPAALPQAAPVQAPADASTSAVEAGDGNGSGIHAVVQDCVLAWLRTESRQALDRIDPDTPFAALGMDSLATASIAVELEQRLGMPIVPELLFDYQSVNELAGFLERQRRTA
jgi:acyl carrier protein